MSKTEIPNEDTLNRIKAGTARCDYCGQLIKEPTSFFDDFCVVVSVNAKRQLIFHNEWCHLDWAQETMNLLKRW